MFIDIYDIFMNKEDTTEEWEKEFDNLDTRRASTIKSFIKSLLTAQKESLKKEIEEMTAYPGTKMPNFMIERQNGYNQALSDVLSLLDNK